MRKEEPGIKSLDKFSTLRGLPTILKKLCKLSENVVDGSGIRVKQFRESIQTHPRHKKTRLSKDVWHKQCTIKKKWSKIIKKTGNEGLAASIPVDKMARHWFWSSKKCDHSAVKMKEIWLGSAEHWRESKKLSNDHHKILLEFLESQVKSIPHYIGCRSTARVESSHRLANKYINKASRVGFSYFALKKGMSTLDFNENANKDTQRHKRKQSWREEVAKRDDANCKRLCIKK